MERTPNHFVEKKKLLKKTLLKGFIKEKDISPPFNQQDDDGLKSQT
jgi:hypothetical protein